MAAVRGQRRRQVRRDRRLAAAALGGEDRDDPALAGAVRVRRAAEALGQVEAALARLHQRAQVVGADDLAHSGAQRLGEHPDVEAPAHQHHADIGAGQPELLGEAERRGQVDVRADDEQPLEAVLAEVADDRRARLGHPHLVAQGQPDVVRGQRVCFPQQGHDACPASPVATCRRRWCR